MTVAGTEVAKGNFDYWTLVAVAVFGTTLGNWVWYWVGRWFGYERLRPLVDRHGRWLTLDWDEVEQMHDWFIRYGSGIVFFCRFLPIARTMISLPAGMVGMGQIRFLLWTAAGSTIWIAALAGAGWFAGQFSAVEEIIGVVALVAIASIVLLYVYRVITWKPKTPRP